MDSNISALVSAVMAGMVRHGLVAIGAVVGVQGVDSATNVNMITGAVMIVVGLGWSATQKWLIDRKLKNAGA